MGCENSGATEGHKRNAVCARAMRVSVARWGELGRRVTVVVLKFSFFFPLKDNDEHRWKSIVRDDKQTRVSPKSTNLSAQVLNICFWTFCRYAMIRGPLLCSFIFVLEESGSQYSLAGVVGSWVAIECADFRHVVCNQLRWRQGGGLSSPNCFLGFKGMHSSTECRSQR